MQRPLQSHQPIEYRSPLLTRITEDEKAPRKTHRAITWAALFVLVVLLAFSTWSYRALKQSKTPLIHMSQGFAASLAAGDVSAAAEHYMDSTTPIHDRLQRLNDLRASLTKDGLAWGEAKPLGFGGSLATVSDPAAPNKTVQAAIGYIYFKTSKGVYAVEVSARKSGSNFCVTRIWKGERISDSPEAHAQKAYEAFAKEAPQETLSEHIENPRYLFVRFPSS